MAERSGPVRISGGYIDVKPRLDRTALSAFRTEITTEMARIGTAASAALSQGIRRGLGGEVKALSSAMGKVSAAQIKANNAVARSSEDLAKKRMRWAAQAARETQRHVDAQKRMYAGLFDQIDRAEAAAARRRADARKRQLDALARGRQTQRRNREAARRAAEAQARAELRAQQRLGEGMLAEWKRRDRAHAAALRENARRNAAALAAQRQAQARFNTWYNAQYRQRLNNQRQAQAAFAAQHNALMRQTTQMQQAANRAAQQAAQQTNRAASSIFRLNQAIGGANRQANIFASQIRSAMAEQAMWLTHTADGIRQFGNRLQSFGQSWTNYVTTPILGSIAAFSFWGLTAAAEIQKAEIGIASMLTSMRGFNETMASGIAERSLAEMRKYAEETAFSFGDMANGIQRLVAVGMGSDTAVSWMKTLGDTAATFGAGTNEMRRAIIALTQSMAAGRVLAQDMNQLTNAGIPIWDLMAKALKKNRGELMQMAREGQLISTDVLPKVMEYLGQFEGNAAKMAEAVPLENLRNKFEQFRNQLADVFREPENADALNALFNNFGETLQSIVPVFRNLVTSLLPALNRAMEVFRRIMSAIEQNPMLGNLLLLAAAMGPLAIAFGLLARTVGFALGPFGKIVSIFGLWDSQSNSLRGKILGAEGALRKFGKAALWVAGIAPFAMAAKGAAKLTGRVAKAGAQKAAQGAAGVLGPGGQAALGAGLAGVSGKLKDLLAKVPGLQKLVGVLGNLKTLLRTPWGIAAIGAAVVALGGLGVAIMQAWKHSEAFRGALGHMWFQVRDIFTKLRDAFSNVFGGKSMNDIDGFAAKMQAFGDWLAAKVLWPINSALMWVRENFGTLFAGAVLGFETLANVIIGNVSPILSGLWSILSSLFSMIGSVIKVVWQAVTQFLNWIGITGKVSDATDGMTVAGGNLGKGIVIAITVFQTFGKVMNASVSIIKVVAEAFAGLFTIVGRSADALGKLLRGDFSGAWDTFKSGFGDAFERIQNAVSQTGSKLMDALDIKGTYEDAARRFNEIYKRATADRPTSRKPSEKKPTSGGAPNTGLPDGASVKKKKAKKKADEAKKRFEAAKKTLLGAFGDFISSMSGTADQVREAGNRLAEQVEEAFDAVGRSRAGDRAVKYLEGVNKKLVSLATKRDEIIKKIEEATSFREDVTSAARDAASLGNLPYSNTTAAGIREGLEQRLAKINRFVSSIKALAARGINKNLLRQVVDMGPIDGLALAETLLAADKKTFAAINAAQSKIDKAANQLGATATDVVFGSIDELKKKGNALQKQMNKIASDAIKKVGQTFGIGWSDIRKVTAKGLANVNATLNDSLKTTKSTVTSAAKVVKSSWTGMVQDMNKTTAKMVTVTYGKGAQKVVNTMASIAGTKKPLPDIGFKYSTGGVTPGYAPRSDTVPAMLSPGEGILVPELTRQLGASTIHAWNKAAMLGRNVFSTGGVVDGARWVNDHKNDPYKGYEQAMKAALKAVVDPSVRALSAMSKFGGLEGGGVKSQYPALIAWAKKLDKMSLGSAAGVIKVAASQIGQGDRGGFDNNKNKYNNFNGEAWCADFISWVVDKAKANRAYWNSPQGTPDNRWPAVATWIAKSGGKRPVSQARPGDLATYNGNGHINLVVKNLGGGRLLTIGGNQGPLVESGIRSNADGILRPNFGKNTGTGSINPWPGSLDIPTTGNHELGGGVDYGGGSPGQNRALGRRMLADVGYGEQWGAFDSIAKRESGWNRFAKNRSSGAYGIPQALPPSKMASAGSDWKTNAATQIRWMIDYILGRYGSPNKAWSFWQRHNWYENGAWKIPNNNHPAMLHRGEMVVPSRPAESFRDALSGRRSVGGDTINNNITLNNQPGLPSERQVVKAMSYAHTLYGRR